MTNEDPGFDALKSAQAQVAKRTGRSIVAYPARIGWAAKLPRPTELLQYVLFIGGLAAITVGCYMIYRPLGPIVGGAVAVSLGMLLSSETDESRSTRPQSR